VACSAAAVPVDVTTEIEIARPRDEVATFAADPDNASAWYENIEQVDWRTPRPLAVGSQVAFVAHFMRRRLEYTYEIIELVPGERLVMRTATGSFPMETTYTWASTSAGATRMTLRNRGEPSGFAKIGAPMLARAMRKATTNDLARLKALLEQRPVAT
jgi:polyketide cyclase/dehydrase/lipid transport protein